MAMKMSLQSSPGTKRKSPGVDTKPAKKPDVGTSTTNSPLVLTPTNEARATSTPKDAVPSPLSTPVRRTGGTPARRVPAANDSTVSDSTLDNVSELFRKGNSRLFGDDEIEKLFSPTTTEETAEETQHTCKNVILGLKAAEVKRNSPLAGRCAVSPGGHAIPQPSSRSRWHLPEWKRQLQEQRAMKEEKKKNDNMTDSKVVKEATIPDWKKELLRKKKATPEPSPVTKPQEPDKEASPEELTKAKERAKDVTPPKEVPLEDVSAKSITGASAVREVVAKKQKSPTPEAKKQKSPTPEAKKQKSPTPEAKKQKSPTPEAKKQKSPTPEAKKQKSPTPEAKKQKSPTPEAKKQKSPTPEAKKQKSPTPEAKKQKSPTPEAKKQKSPTPEAKKQKSPTPEAKKQKSPTPEAKKQKSPTPEAKKQKSPTPEAKKQKSPTPEAKKQKSPTPEAKKQKSPTPEAKKQKSPTPEAEKEKEDQPEPMKDAKKDSDSMPDWKKRLEERRASREREVSPALANKETLLSKSDSDSKPDWKKRLEERRASREREVSPALLDKETLLSKSDSDKVPDWKKRLEERRASREREVSPVSADKETLLPKDEERRPSKEERPPVPVMNKEILMAKMEELRASREKASVPAGKEALMAKSGESHTSGEEKPPLPVGKEALLAKTADTKVPEWRRRLLERKKESGSVSVPTKTVAVASSEPEWKKRAEERRKQREAEKTAASAARTQQKDRKEDVDVREWQKGMQERKEIRERGKRAKEAAKKGTTQSSRALFDASITEKGPEKKPLFDSSLQAGSEKGSPEKDKSAKKKENKAKIESLFADDDEVIVKQDTSSDSSRQRTQGDAAALKDWVVVGEEEVKQADKDKEEFERSVGGVASKVEVDKEEVKKGGEVKTSDSSQVRAGSTTAVKNAEHKEKRNAKPNRTDNLSKQTEVKVASNATKSSVAKIVAFFGSKASTKVKELSVPVTSVTEVEQRSSSVPPVDKEPGLKPRLDDKPAFSSSEQIRGASVEFGSWENVSSEEEVFSPVRKTAPDSSDTSCKESTQASQASLISMSDTASSVPRSATISGLDSEEKEDTPPPGYVRRTSLKFSPMHDSQQQASSGVPRWKKLMSWRKNLDQDSGYMTGSASSMDSKGVRCDSN